MKKVVFDGECPVCTSLKTFAENKMESNLLVYDPGLVRMHADICKTICRGALFGTDPAWPYP